MKIAVHKTEINKEEINKMKKALSLVLMIVLIVALAVPAASAADDTIKIGLARVSVRMWA